MEYVFVGDSENSGARGNKIKRDRMERGSSLGGGTRKKLADISNLPQGAEPLSQIENLKTSSHATNLYIEQLHKENVMLMKVLADRNKIIELSGTELQKLRIHVQKLQLQNQQLAQANSQMLAELNSGKEKRKVLDHELGCKNGILHAIQLELEPKVKMAKRGRVMESSQPNKGDDKPFTTNKRHQSKEPSLDTSISKPVERKRKADNERHLLRRSKRFISEEPDSPEEPEPSEALSKDTELHLASTSSEPLTALENKRPCLRNQSAQLQSDEAEPTKHMIEIDVGKPIEAETKAGHNKRSSLRRQSMRFKSEEPVVIEAVSDEIEPPLDTSHIADVELLESKQNKRHCTKTESGRVKPAKCEPAEGLFDIAPLSNNLEHKSLSTPSVKTEDGERNSLDRDEVPEHARFSMARPLRQAAVKIQSYKELTLKVKMRRTE